MKFQHLRLRATEMLDEYRELTGRIDLALSEVQAQCPHENVVKEAHDYFGLHLCTYCGAWAMYQDDGWRQLDMAVNKSELSRENLLQLRRHLNGPHDGRMT